eukprot:TRINITY_DN5259_c0_g1_i1.p1 TRINITY_DN5259_c0_g1~~TRINITY_DN5259_c0_g1_i1.p1  ORF type:complete len:104 (+),score=12.65 TRINITY_DN5259_c0_g1_i1:198-509(+)
MWGVIMLVAIGFALYIGYPGIDGVVPSICHHGAANCSDDLPPEMCRTKKNCEEDHHKAAFNSFYAALIYVFFIVLSVARIVHLKYLARKKSIDDFDQYGQIES